MSESEGDNAAKEVFVEYRASIRVISPTDRIDRFKEAGKSWRSLPAKDKGSTNALSVMTMLTNARCGEKSSDYHHWGNILDDEIVAISVEAYSSSSGGDNGTELLESYANRTLKPLAKGKAYLSPTCLLGGVKISAKLIQAHAKALLSSSAATGSGADGSSASLGWLESLLTCQLWFLEKLSLVNSTTADKQRKAAERVIQNLLIHWPTTACLRVAVLLPMFVKLICSDKNEIEMISGLSAVLRVVSDQSKASEDEKAVLGKWKTTLLTKYADVCLSNGSKNTSSSSDDFKALIQSIDNQEFKEIIFPRMEKLLRLSPEAAIDTVANFAAQATDNETPRGLIILSADAMNNGLLAPLLKLLRGTNEEASFKAYQALSNFLRMVDPSELSSVVEGIMSKVDEKAATWMHRNSEVALLQSVAPIAESLASEVRSVVAFSAVSSLMNGVKKEQNPAVKTNMVLATSKWIACLNDTNVVSVIDWLMSVLPTCPLAVLSVFRSAPTTIMPHLNDQSLSKIFDIVNASVKKSKTPQLEAVVAMDLFLTLSKCDSKFAKELKTIESVLLNTSSFVYAKNLFSLLDKEISVSEIEWLHLVCLPNIVQTASQGLGMLEALFGEGGKGGLLLARCITCEVLEVRQEALKVLKALAETSDKVSNAVAGGLLQLLSSEAKAEENLNGTIRRQIETNEEGSSVITPNTFLQPPYFFKTTSLKEVLDLDLKQRKISSSSLRASLPALAQTSNGISISALPQLLLLCYHPSLAASAKHGQKLWKSTIASLLKTSQEVEAHLSDNKVSETLSGILLRYLASPLAAERETGNRVISDLLLGESPCGLSGVQLVEEKVLPAILVSLSTSSTALSSLTKQDIDLLHCPPNVLLSEFMKKQEQPPPPPSTSAGGAAGGTGKVVVPKVRGNKSGGFGAEAEELAWEEQVRAELEEKKRLKAEAEAASKVIAKPVVNQAPVKAVKSKKQKKEEEELAALGLGGVDTKKKKKDSKPKASSSSTTASSSSSSSSGVVSGGGASVSGGGGGGGAMPTASMTPEARQLFQESETREKTKQLIGAAKAALQVVSTASLALSQSRQEATVSGSEGRKGKLLCDFLQPVYSLLVHDLVHDKVYECLKALVTCLDDRFKQYRDIAATCLRLSVVEPSKVDVDMMNSFCTEVYNIVVRSRGSSSFTPSTVHFVYPIFNATIRSSSSLSDRVLSVISVLLNDIKPPITKGLPNTLRLAYIQLLLFVLNEDHFLSNKTMMSTATNALSSLCANTSALSREQWLEIMSDNGFLGFKQSRLAALQTVKELYQLQQSGLYDDLGLEDALLESRVWLCCHDAEEDVKEMAREVWSMRGKGVSPIFPPPLIALLGHDKAEIRQAAACAIAGGLGEHASVVGVVNSSLQDVFLANGEPEVEAKGAAALETGISIEEYLSSALPGTSASTATASEEEKKRALRMACCETYAQCGAAKVLGEDHKTLTSAMNFLVTKALCDPIEQVRSEVLNAAQSIINGYGSTDAPLLLSLLETSMAQTGSKKKEDAVIEDRRKEGLVVLLGAVAKHLDKSDPKVSMIINSLLEALSIPSESVQRCVANSLAPLIASVRAIGGEYLDILLARAIESETVAERRGAAYGVSAVVKGLGIGSLKQRNVMVALESACTSSPTAKQGALFCFELLCDRLRILFEPYVVSVLPLLLKSFSDGNQHVRDAAYGAARVIMQHLSQHGVKLVLPKILEALEDPAWRTKQAAIQLLGAMAHCAPKPLGHCLPQIVPRLTNAFSDTHPKVRESGKRALKDVRSVVRNPEVAGLSDVLLQALTEPSKHTKSAIDALLVCEFIHSIDAPSLALLVPVLQRGLKDRSADVKRKAALISGNMSSMISDPKDMLPYLPSLMPGLKETVLDPIPDVRSTSSKAIGQLAMGLGEEHVSEVLPWLLETLKTAPSTVERSGAAQGISEVLAALGDEKTRECLNDLLPLSTHPSVGVREGVLWVLVFLPTAISASIGDFSQYLERDALPVVLGGLADELEPVREVALRAGQVLVATHGRNNLDMILPSIEQGIKEANWRIRHSSVTLLGDLLYLLGNTKACVQDEGEDEDVFEQDDGRGDANASKMVAQALGVEKRNEILASLYILRSDTSSVVRQSTLQVWKTMVPNTPRTLREILPNVTTQIVNTLANGHPDRRVVAGRALGDVVKKLGERVLPEMIPFMRAGLSDDSVEKRQGICIGLGEVLSCITKRQLESYLPEIIDCVEVAMCDPEEGVRNQASVAFTTLHRLAGAEAVDVVLPSLLEQLNEEDTRQRALNGLCQMLKVRSKELLGVVVPALLKRPMSEAHMVALGTIAVSSSSYIHNIAHKAIPTVIAELVSLDALAMQGDENAGRLRDVLDKSAGQFMGAISSYGVVSFSTELVKPLLSEDAPTRAWGVRLMGLFFSENKIAEFDDQVPIFIKELVRLFTDSDRYVLDRVRDCLSALVKSKPLDSLLPHVDFTRNYIVSLISEARHRKGANKGPDFLLPLFNIPKGIEPLLVYYQHALLSGSSAQREVAASGIGDLVEYTSPQELKPFLIKMTGPLIRVVGDKFPGSVKAAILQSLRLLLDKGGAAQKPFVPQLQKSFVRALGDPTTAVRDRAGLALGQLMELTTRVDPLVADLTNSANADNSPEVTEAYLNALASVFTSSGEKVTLGAKETAVDSLMNLLSHNKDVVRVAAAHAMSSIAIHLQDMDDASAAGGGGGADEEEGGVTLNRLIVTRLLKLLEEGSDQWQLKHGVSRALGQCCLKVQHEASRSGLSRRYLEIMTALQRMVKEGLNKNVYLQIYGCEGLVLVCKAIKKNDVSTSVKAVLHSFVLKGDVFSTLIEAYDDEAPDVKVSVLACLKALGKSFNLATRSKLTEVMPCLIEAVKDTNIRIKLAAERALLHILEVNTRSSTVEEYVSAVDSTTARFVRDMVRKVLVKLQADSE